MNEATILVVEDDATIARFVELELSHEGYTVLRAEDGPAALEMVEASPPDLMVLDLMLPNLDGLEVARRLREGGKSFPILMLTARVETGDVVSGFDAGADDYLRKPFEMPELVSRIRVLLKRSESEAPASQYRAWASRSTPPRAGSPSTAHRSSSQRRSTSCWSSSSPTPVASSRAKRSSMPSGAASTAPTAT